ncbi:hypothetical protein L0668_09875 [Paraglaciecola aquimarina]|uniref:KfrA N-terminal DNA-binding domain-containing protein n=1 Tax=Paraglaciecola algarum TaxID=3050085 RepID=A0ABS9D9F9_9ALTE|nr:hypothetical protein [Paraglaciecola sp. G1-23]MCF2948414.1 hypothetical protein [Paraglaciecola sp. G1-23]
MSNIDYIINLCHDIHAQGKKPSVALIRNQASKSLPIPEVIKALQNWKANPSQTKKVISEPDTPATSANTLEERVEYLEQALQKVIQELERLKNSN